MDKKGDAKARRKQFFASLTLPRLNELRGALGANKDADAFHILTAERAGLNVFLTDDGRLLQRIAGIKVELYVRVLSPAQLLDAVGNT